MGIPKVQATKVIKLLGITIDQKITYREHTAKGIINTRNAISLIQRLAFA